MQHSHSLARTLLLYLLFSPSRGCKNCPMFGVGLSPEFQKKEETRKEKLAKAEMKKKMESQNKRADL